MKTGENPFRGFTFDDAPVCWSFESITTSEHATSAPAELGGEIHHVSRNRARPQVLPQAPKLHVYRSGTLGAFCRERTYVYLVPCIPSPPGEGRLANNTDYV